MGETSVVELIGKLCDIHLGPTPRAFRVQPAVKQNTLRKRLKQKAFSALFCFLKQSTANDNVAQNIKTTESILLECYKMARQRRFEDADKLENLFNQLKTDIDDDMWKRLRFIVALSGTGGATQGTLNGMLNIPQLKDKQKKQILLPSGPLCYGDVQDVGRFAQFYMHYPGDLFEKPFVDNSIGFDKTLCGVFDMLPGTGLSNGGIFSNKFLLDDEHEQTTHQSLFGGLIEGRVSNLGAQLELPDDLKTRIPKFKCHRSTSTSKISEESGLGSESASMSTSIISLNESGYDDSIWERALTDPRSDHYTWEWIGYLPGPTEKPHLTEAGPKVFDIVVKLRHRLNAMVCPEFEYNHLVQIESSILVKYILMMVIGIPSNFFPFNQATQTFSIRENIHISGLSPEMLASCLSEFVEMGSLFARLSEFSRPPVLNSFYNAGLTFQAFAKAIRKFLSCLTAAILRIPVHLPLLSLKFHLLKAMEQIRHVAQLCLCHDKSPPVALQNFPTGMKLLSYVYNETEIYSSSSHYSIMLSILQTTFAPFVLYIRDWVFHGVHRDFYSEFMIQVDLSCLEYRDENYWTAAYSLRLDGKGDGEEIPQFLRDSIHDIVTCGKSLNLLRACSQQHFLCNLSESDLPALSITFSNEDLRAAEKNCQIYVGRMKQIAEEKTVDRQAILRKAEQQKIEIQQIAIRVADQEIVRLQGIIDERKRKAKSKKQAEFVHLKEQMNADLKRRAEDKEEAKDRDKNFMAILTKKEHALREEEVELEKKVKEELIAYYTELGKEAMHRERLALWRIRRAQLETSRVLFLEADAERWKQELTLQLKTQDVPDSASHLPNWATRFSDQRTPILVSREEEITLPSWAKQKVVNGVNDSNLHDDGVVLPRWIQQESSDNTSSHVLGDNVKLPKWAMKDSQASETANKTADDLKDIKNDQKDNKNNYAKPNDNDSTLATDAMVVNSECPNMTSQLNSAVICVPQLEPSTIASGTKNTIESNSLSNMNNYNKRHPRDESEENPIKFSVTFVKGKNALAESEEIQRVRYTKNVPLMFAAKESDSSDGINPPHLKSIDGKFVNAESSEERQVVPRLHRDIDSRFNSQETTAQVWTIKKPNMFGHVSQLSNVDYILNMPKLKRQMHQHANMESDFKDFAIKPCIRTRKTISANLEEQASTASQRSKTHIQVFSHRNANTESQLVDKDAIAIRRFKAFNVWGHSSDSTIQRLLYGDEQPVTQDTTDAPYERISLLPGLPYEVEPFQTDFENLNQEPSLDLMSNISVVDLGRDLISAVATHQEEVEAYEFTPLSVLLGRSILAPVRAQVELVNSALVNYFTTELKVDSHFEAIRRYLLMADGDFAEILSNILLEKMFKNPKPHEIPNPMFLNGALYKAIRSSSHSNDENAHNLSFAYKYIPTVFLLNAPNSLDCLELNYNVTWPLNIILTSSSMTKYYSVFSFLLQIKRVVWTLKDIWHRLKKDALINKVGNTTQFRHLQLHRQEMEHFVKMMQGYITNQVILVSWQEFQMALAQPIAGLDQLQAIHNHYVDRVISKCLLDKKAEKVMKIIQDIFCLILKFRSHLVSSSWQKSEHESEVMHPNFGSMATVYKSFHIYSFFLFKVVNRLSQKGYQPHLQELLLQLNFNDYYSEAAN